MIKTEVCVLGGGISGMTAAFYLKEKGIPFRLLEKNETPGGVIKTSRIDGYEVEAGPNSIATTPEILELVSDLGIEDKLQRSNSNGNKRYIYRYKQLNAVTMGPGIFFSKLLSFKSKLNIFREAFVPKATIEDESIGDFVRRRLGQDFLDNLINPLVGGIYAGNPELMSLKSTFPKMYDMEQDHGSLIRAAMNIMRQPNRHKREIVSFQGGVSTLIDTIAGKINEELITGAEISDVNKSEDGYIIKFSGQNGEEQIFTKKIISTISAPATGKVFDTVAPGIREQMDKIVYPPIVLLNLAYPIDKISQPLDSFGFLIPEKERTAFLGAVWNSTIFEGKAPEGQALFTLFVGGMRNREVLDNLEENLEKARKEFEQVMGISGPVSFTNRSVMAKAIPQFHLGHYKIMEFIDELEKANPGLTISGNWRGGVAMGACVQYNKDLISNLYPDHA